MILIFEWIGDWGFLIVDLALTSAGNHKSTISSQQFNHQSKIAQSTMF